MRKTQRKLSLQFSIRFMLILMLFVAVILGWRADHVSKSLQLKQASDRYAQLQSEFASFGSWYGRQHSLRSLPEYHYDALRKVDLIHEFVESDRGFHLLHLRPAHEALSVVGEKGTGFRVRGGSFQFNLVCEEVSSDPPVQYFGMTGPVNTRETNSVDGTFVYLKPRIVKVVPGWTSPKRATIGNGGLRRSDDDYVFAFEEDGVSCIQRIPVTDVWPDWVFTSADATRSEGSSSYPASIPIPWGASVVLFSEAYSADDGRKARLRLIVTCTNEDDGLATSPLSIE